MSQIAEDDNGDEEESAVDDAEIGSDDEAYLDEAQEKQELMQCAAFP